MYYSTTYINVLMNKKTKNLNSVEKLNYLFTTEFGCYYVCVLKFD